MTAARSFVRSLRVAALWVCTALCSKHCIHWLLVVLMMSAMHLMLFASNFLHIYLVFARIRFGKPNRFKPVNRHCLHNLFEQRSTEGKTLYIHQKTVERKKLLQHKYAGTFCKSKPNQTKSLIICHTKHIGMWNQCRVQVWLQLT